MLLFHPHSEKAEEPDISDSVATLDILCRPGPLLGTTTLLGLPVRPGLPRLPKPSGATGSVLANAVTLRTPVLARFAEHFPRYVVYQIDDEPLPPGAADP